MNIYEIIQNNLNENYSSDLFRDYMMNNERLNLTDGRFVAVLPVTTENFELDNSLEKQLKEEGKYGWYIGIIYTDTFNKPYPMNTLPVFGDDNEWITSWFTKDKESQIDSLIDGNKDSGILNALPNNLDESVGDFQNTSLSQPAGIINSTKKINISEDDESSLTVRGTVSETKERVNSFFSGSSNGISNILDLLNNDAQCLLKYNSKTQLLQIKVENNNVSVVVWNGRAPQ